MLNTTWVEIHPLPLLEEQPDWNLCFRELQSYIFVFPSYPDPEEATYLLHIERRWLIVFHWVIRKKWCSKHKIPHRKTLANLYEPEGELWYWFLELCIQCHSTYWGKNYINACEWYQWLVHERTYSAYEQCLQSMSMENEETFFACSGKQEHLRDEKRILSDLRNDINPWHPEINKHHYCLMKACLEMKNKSNIFQKKYWSNFLRSYSKWIVSVEKNFSIEKIEVSKDKKTGEPIKKLITIQGRGRYRPSLPLAPQEYIQTRIKKIYLYPKTILVTFPFVDPFLSDIANNRLSCFTAPKSF